MAVKLPIFSNVTEHFLGDLDLQPLDVIYLELHCNMSNFIVTEAVDVRRWRLIIAPPELIGSVPARRSPVCGLPGCG